MNKLTISVVILILASISGIGAYLTLTSPVDITENKKPLFGTMLAFNINDAAVGDPNTGIPGMLKTIREKGWTEFKKDDPAYQNFKNNLEKIIQDRTELVKTTGFFLDREVIGYFTWNVIEPQKGQFNWELTDLYVQAALNAGIKISAVIQPFASWDQKNTSSIPGCNALDFAYFDYKAGPPNDWTEYQNFLEATVKRYKDVVSVWEIGNEYDGQCGGYQNDPEGYLKLLKISHDVIKGADPEAKISNGGALEFPSDNIRSFWTTFFQLGGNQYLDYFNIHYNIERGPSPALNPATFQEVLTFFNDLMGENGGKKPLYITEFGIYSGSPSAQPIGQPPQLKKLVPNQNLPNQSEDSQAALYFKDSILAFANGTETIFIDLVSRDNNLIGSSMAFNAEGQPRLFLTTLKTIASKIEGFSRVEKIADSQYKFTIGNKTIYTLWAGTLPDEISGNVKVTDIKGQEQLMDAAEIKLNADQPIFIELHL